MFFEPAFHTQHTWSPGFRDDRAHRHSGLSGNCLADGGSHKDLAQCGIRKQRGKLQNGRRSSWCWWTTWATQSCGKVVGFQLRCRPGCSSSGQLPAPLRALGWPSRARCSTAQLMSLCSGWGFEQCKANLNLNIACFKLSYTLLDRIAKVSRR